jgi:hypothetical protein
MGIGDGWTDAKSNEAAEQFQSGGFSNLEHFMSDHVAKTADLGRPPVVGDTVDDMETLLMTEKEKIFKEASATASFDMRSKVGQWWTRELKDDGKLKQMYAAVGRGYEVQREFRQQWAKKKFESMMTQRTHTEELVGKRKM